MIGNLKEKKQARDINQFLVDIYRKIPRNIKIIFIYSIICGLFTHLYMFTNKLIVQDELYNLFSKNDTTTSGRWFLSVLSAISSEYSMPWVNGIISIFAISFAICFIVKTIKLEKIPYMIVASSVLITFPAVAATLGYMFTADAYFIGMALASISIYIIDKYRLKMNDLYNSTTNNKGGPLIGALTLIICIYAAYSGYIITNKSYLVMDLSFKKTYSNASRILNKLEDLEDFSIDKKVAFIGNSEYNPYFNSKMFIETKVNELHGMTGVSLTTICRSEDSWYLFIYDYLGVPLMSPGNEKIAEIKKNKEFLDMPLYPQKGSIKVIDDIAVVKLSTAAIPSHIRDVYIDNKHSSVKVNFMRYEGQIYIPIRFISELMQSSLYYDYNTLYIDTNLPANKKEIVRERLYTLQAIKFTEDDILVNGNVLVTGIRNMDCNGDKYIPLELAKDIFNIDIEYNMEDEVLLIEKNKQTI